MPVMIALFRGINVGGNTLLMSDLVAILQRLGCKNVSTFIQSGNAVFSPPNEDINGLAGRITAGIKSLRGFEPRVLLLSHAEIESALAANPFPQAASDPSKLHLGFLASTPQHPDLQAIEKSRIPSEACQLIGRVFYLFAPEGVGRSKLAAGAEKWLGVPMTDRNWNTVVRLAEMARALA